MNYEYELAKELKDSGFPQTWHEGMSFYLEGELVEEGCEDHGHDHDSKKGVKIPALSELIEACGEDFRQLARIVHTQEAKSGMRWKADAKKTKTTNHSAFGATPEEAVARLWLALSKKDN